MKTIQNTSAIFFIVAVAILSTIATLGVWDIFSKDVISKSFQTLGLLALVAIIIMAAGRYVEGRSEVGDVAMPDLPSPIFKIVRRMTLAVLIISVSLLALLGVLAIWEVIQDKDVLYKSLSSLGIFAFGAFVIVMTCLDREGKLYAQHKNMSTGSIIGLLILGFLLFSVLL
ncbi:MAG: hypothetical protein Q7R89_02620 [bacterium]|nr:hypothetical protein [bacterium]